MTHPLDATVAALRAALDDRRVVRPRVLFLLATGAGELPEELGGAHELPLAELELVPPPWNTAVLHSGRLGELGAWVLEDASGDPLDGRPQATWARGLPLWLAAACGAGVCVHASAGSALRGDDESRPRAPVGGFALARDHLNVSGETPLIGLGQSRLGPLFPDVSQLHHLGLRRAALGRAEELGLPATEAVVACTAGPALETAAERRSLARAGADVVVQGLATPLLAAAHAGLAALSVVCVADAESGAVDVVRLVESARESEEPLAALLLSLVEDLERAVAAQEPTGG